MRRSFLLLVALAGTGAMPLAAQSSQFGVRGIGLPGRQLSVRALGTGGAISLFDGGSSQNPAALSLLTSTSMLFSTTQSWRTSESPGGEAASRDQRFPHIMVGGPVPGSRFAVGLSFSTYADRDFTLVTEGVESPRGIPVEVTDTLGSTGGVNDLRVGVAWSPSPRIQLGAGVHFLTGSNRVFSRRAWADTSYLPIRQAAELTYSGVGVSVGIVLQPTTRLVLAGSVRQDGRLDIERDSAAAGGLELPWTFAAAARFRPIDRLAVSAQISSRNWAVADADLVAQGGVGARNTIEYAAGLEFVRNTRRPDHLPLRLGVRHGQLPFLLAQGSQPKESAVSLGTGFRFAGDLGGLDLALERLQRKQGPQFREGAWQLSIGVSVRAPTPQRQ